MSNKVIVLKLQYPVQLANNITLDELKIRERLKGKDFRLLDPKLLEKGNPGQMLKLLTALSEIEPEIADELDLDDIKAGLEVIKKNQNLMIPGR